MRNIIISERDASASEKVTIPLWSDGKDDPEPSRFLAAKHASWHHVQLDLREKLISNTNRGNQKKEMMERKNLDSIGC